MSGPPGGARQTRERPVLIVGFPRSGTTWVARVLGETPNVKYVHEPDNDRLDPYALQAKRSLGRFPALDGEDDPGGYESLWQGAFGGGEASRSVRARVAWKILNSTDREVLSATVGRTKPMPVRLRIASSLARPLVAGGHEARMIVKSVHAPLALDWITGRFGVELVIVLRHPVNVLASWVDLSLPDADRRLDEDPRVHELFLSRWAVAPPRPDASALERAAWHAGLFSAALHEHRIARNNGVIVRHESYCVNPEVRFRELAESLRLTWSDEASALLRDSDREGTGFAPERITAEQPYRWQRTFDRQDVEKIRAVLERFPYDLWTDPPAKLA